MPGWATPPGLLPPVALRDGSGVLPVEAVANLITVFAISRLDAPYAGVDVVKTACEPVSLAEFRWGLFQRWRMSGASSRDGWVLDMLGLIGDDETVRLLSPLVLAWPGEGGHTKAVAGVAVLAAIGTDVALMHLHGIAERSRFKKQAGRQRRLPVRHLAGGQPGDAPDPAGSHALIGAQPRRRRRRAGQRVAQQPGVLQCLVRALHLRRREGVGRIAQQGHPPGAPDIGHPVRHMRELLSIGKSLQQGRHGGRPISERLPQPGCGRGLRIEPPLQETRRRPASDRRDPAARRSIWHAYPNL